LYYSNAFIGLYLIRESAIDIAAMVESEKTIIIICILMPEYISRATGSKTGLNEKVIQPLKGHNVILFPDKTEYSAWADKTTLLSNLRLLLKNSSKYLTDNI
jgi:hypothetical protein